MSSKRRSYLNLKQSIIALFKTPAHWLKEMTGKWSIFEKPYLDQDYRAMHLKFPEPTWKGSGGAVPPRIWPERSGKHTFIFSEGTCTIWSFGGDCGEIVTISGWIWDPYFTTGGTTFDWKVISSEPENATIIEIAVSPDGVSAKIKVQLSDTWTGTAVISVSATMVGGTMLKETAYEVPTGQIPTIKQAFANLLPLYEKRATISHNCGTVDIEIACCDDTGISWDDAYSADWIDPGEWVGERPPIFYPGEAAIGIIDAGAAGPYSWSVSGTGFTLAQAVTTGLTNVLYADDTACGPATITVTGCEGSISTSGIVKSTDGVWNYTGTTCPDMGSSYTPCPWTPLVDCDRVVGKYRVIQRMADCSQEFIHCVAEGIEIEDPGENAACLIHCPTVHGICDGIGSLSCLIFAMPEAYQPPETFSEACSCYNDESDPYNINCVMFHTTKLECYEWGCP